MTIAVYLYPLCFSGLQPKVHALGEAATVVASGVRLHCIRSGLVKRVSQVRPDVTPRVNKTSEHLRHWGSQSSMNSSQDTSSSETTTTTLRPPPLVIVFSRGTFFSPTSGYGDFPRLHPILLYTDDRESL